MGAASSAEVIDYSNTQRRSFFGVRAGSDFIKQDEGGRFAQFDHSRDIGGV